MSANSIDGATRLRAFLRALLSTGVWAVIAAQLGMFFVLRGAPAPAAATAQLRLGVLVALFFALFYLIAGASQALAKGRETVSVADVLRAAQAVYLRFLWLGLKAAIVFLILFNLVFSAVLALSGMEMQALFEASVGLYPWIGAAVAFAFVYWMPVVFVRSDFGLIETVRAGFAALWRDRRHAGFLAFLTLAPTALATFLGDAPPALAVAAVNVVGGLLGWTAYAFCVARLQAAQPAPVLAAVS